MSAEEETRVEVDGRTLRLSNLDKVLYPRTGTTKGEVLHYYAQVAPVLLPLVADRAVTRIRWPNGTEQHRFFEKNAPAGAPSWLRIAKVPTTGSRGGSRHGDHLEFPVIDGLASLTYLANLAALELHVHQWRVGRNGQPKRPDRLVIDLDPGEGAGLAECAEAALLVRERLAADDLDTRAVTSGSKGIHLYADLPGTQSADEVRDYVHGVAEELEKAHRGLLLSQMTKAKRSGKVFLDWSQNAASKTTITPYSLRGRETPYVAAPRSWDEIEAGAEDPLALEQLTYAEVLDRVAGRGDLFTS
ncbi:ATP-dependent DNA ligase [Marmoricola endophyticus]|uniref:ATP-dependent DNA ligase n=1 Tax=Marmoricola endophyticus TaxID=2040280 RepID=A0A917BU34_9ACTN|nr:non-homologous end-joining DNA ligase [Marmoricola endophyticus]GGF56760.1 ATP-dependent DNA ligase [Marmoricola endophyticus]